MSHRLNAFGQLVSAVGDGVVAIDGTVIGRGGAACWLDDRRVLYNGHDPVTGAWATLGYNTITGNTSVLVPGGGEFLAAGGGRYAVQLAGIVTASFSIRAGARMALTGTDGRGAASADGTVALCSDASCTAFDLYAPDGSVTHVEAVAYGLCVVGPGRAVWTGGSVGVDFRPARPMRAPKWVELAGEVWLVGWVDGIGLVAQVNGAADGYVLASDGTQFDHDARAVNGELLVAWSTSTAEAPGEDVKFHVDRAVARQAIVPPAPVVAAIGRPLVVAWFTDQPTSAPGNADILVDFHGRPSPGTVVRRDNGEVLAHYVAAEADGTMDGLERAIAAQHAAEPRIPVLCYWPVALQAGRAPAGAELVGVVGYGNAGEAMDALERRIRAAVARCPAAFIVAQCYTSNAANTSDLRSLVPVYARIARDCPNVLGLAIFSAGSRATGFDAHPEVADLWRAVIASVTGVPALPQPSPVPAPPPPPKPIPPPVPPPVPVSDYPLLSEVSMSFPKNVAIIGPGGLFASVNKVTRALTFDKTAIGGDEQFTLEQPDDRTRLQLTSQSLPEFILGEDVTQYGSNDIRKLYALVEAGTRGNYESWFVGKTPSGLIVAFIEYLDQGVRTKPFAGPTLTLVEL